MLGYSILQEKNNSGKRLTFAHILEEKSIGNMVTELFGEDGNFESAYVGPADGIKPKGLGFMFIPEFGFKYCGFNTQKCPVEMNLSVIQQYNR